MRRIALVLLGAALLGAASWFCSSDAPSPTPPRVITPGSSGSGPLQIRLFTSNANPVAGSCTAIQALVTLNGANVADGTSVSFVTDLATSTFLQNGLPLISVVTQSGVATTGLCSTASGLATVRANATVGSDSASATIQIAFQPSANAAPFFTFCSPSFGPAAGGTVLQINGGRFFGTPSTSRVTFTVGAVTREALVTGLTANTITVVTPAFPEAVSTSVPATITVTFGTNTTTPVTLSLPNCFAYGTSSATTPTISAVVPSSGSNEGGTLVSIFGSGFSNPLQVFFGPVEATVVSVSFNQIVVKTPPASGAGLPNLNQTVAVRVHEITSGLDATKDAAFRFVTALQITAMDNTLQPVDKPFTPVTVHGQGFLAPVAVTLAGIPATPISVSATELIVLPGTPFLNACTDLTGPVVVTNIDSGDTATGPNFTYQVVITTPTINSVSPSSGPPGTTVTITGTHLGNITSVTFGGQSATIVSVSPTQIVVIAPPIDKVAVCGVDTGTSVDVTVTSSTTKCTATSTKAFQYPCIQPTPVPVTPPTPPPTATFAPTATPTVTPTPTPTVGGIADLALTKGGSPSSVITGGNVTYQLGVTNNGPNTAQIVRLTDPLPGGTVFQSFATSQGSCSGPTVNQPGTVVCELGSIPSSGFALVTIVVKVTATAPTTILNTAFVEAATVDPNGSNNTASASTSVVAVSADLSITKIASPNTVFTGKPLTYTLTVVNNGPSTATNVEVSDALPPGTTFGSCFTTPPTPCPGPFSSGNTIRAELGNMPAGTSATVTIVVNVTAPGGTTITNTAAVTSDTPDPNPANNTASVTTFVSP